MKIARAEALRVKLVMRTPFEISSRRFQDKDAVLVRLHTTDGLIGYGESGALPSPFYSPEYIDTAYAVIKDYLLPEIVGKAFANVTELEATYAWIKGHHFAKVALEGAYWHLLAQERGVPLYQIWGGQLTRVEVGTSLGIEPSVTAVLDKVQVALDQGFRRIKIKIKPGFDVVPVRAIRDRFGPIALMVDANSSYTLDPAHVQIMRELDTYDLMMIEQPLAHDDIIDHATLQKEISTPICLDESIHTLADARQAIQIGACKIINIKPPRVGGFAVALRIAEVAHQHGLGVWCGGMFESGIGKGFNAHLCSRIEFTLPADNSGSRSYYEFDLLMPANPIVMDQDAHITLPQKVGLGWEIDTSFIEQHLSAQAVFAE